ncbi:MAG: hypothetical protein R3C59_00905 [Planctomycetaceae bacterium]
MAGLLKKLKRAGGRLKGGAEAAVSVPYELTCDCGSKVTGMRRATWIEGECQTCYQSLFVLPANVYPSTKSVPSEVLGGTFAERLKSVVAELFPKKDSPVRAKEKPESNTPAADSAFAAEAVVKPKFTFPQIDVVGFLKRVFTPFRLLMLAIVTVLVLTVYWMTCQRAMEAARQVWLKTPERVEQLMQEGNLVELESVLAEAIGAAIVLQKDDPESRWLSNLLDETRTVNSLSINELLSGFHNAYDDRGRLKDDAESIVQTVCDSGPFVFDTTLNPKSGVSDDYLIDFPASPGRHPVHIIVPMPELQKLLETADDHRAIFAVEIQSVRAPEQRTYDPWILQIKPGSFVLFTSMTHCEAFGLTSEVDPTLPAILQRQLEFVENSDTRHSEVDVTGEKPDR